MSLPDLAAWQVEHLRLTAFPAAGAKLTPEEWWTALVGYPPDSVTSRPKAGLHQQEGTFEGRRLLLRIHPDRIDWRLSAPAPEVPDELSVSFPSAGAYTETLGVFHKLAIAWLKVSPSLTRLAYGAVLMLPVEDRQKGYLQLGEYLRSMKIDPESSDFSYQINRPRPSRAPVAGLRINRLTKWSVALFQVLGLSLQGETPPRTNFTGSKQSMCRLELDINTAPDFEGPLPQEALVPVFEELVASGGEIVANGDIP